jgi:toxin YoeB
VKNRGIIFDQQFREDLRYWYKIDKKLAFKILDLIEAITLDPSNINNDETLN